MSGPHPGSVLLRLIQERHLTVADFESAGLDSDSIRNLVNQRCDLSGKGMKMVAKIAALTGTTAPYWANIQDNYTNKPQPPRKLKSGFVTGEQSSLVARRAYTGIIR